MRSEESGLGEGLRKGLRNCSEDKTVKPAMTRLDVCEAFEGVRVLQFCLVGKAGLSHVSPGDLGFLTVTKMVFPIKNHRV